MKKQNEYMTREESDNRYFTFFWILFLICVLFIVLIMMMVNHFDNKIEESLKDVPHRVCHNEVEVIKYNLYKDVFNNCFPISSEIICDKGLTVSEYEYLEEKCIHFDGFTYFGDTSIIDLSCYVEIFNEVCEIR